MPRQPNILLVHCHDLGRYLHCYGHDTVSTPHLDAFAAEGVLFERAFCTAPQCSPSRASMFTGRYPHSSGVMGLCHAEFRWDLHEDEVHLGQYAKGAGYATAAVGVVHETRSGAARCGLDQHRPNGRAVAAVDNAIELLGEFADRPEKPFYLQVGFIEPHRLPGEDPAADLGFLGRDLEPDDSLGVEVPGYLQDTEPARQEIAELQGAIRHVDTQVGRLLGAVDELGLREDTLVIFTTDHGVALPRAKCSLYDPGIEIALLLRLPSRRGWSGGRVISAMVSNLDFTPTLLEVMKSGASVDIEGRSFAPLLDGGKYKPRDAIFAELTYHGMYNPCRCIRTETHKLILHFVPAPVFQDPSQSWRPRAVTRTPINPRRAHAPLIELYDIQQDPWEQRNLWQESGNEQLTRTLLARLHEHMIATADPLLEGAVPDPTHHRAVAALRSSCAETDVSCGRGED